MGNYVTEKCQCLNLLLNLLQYPSLKINELEWWQNIRLFIKSFFASALCKSTANFSELQCSKYCFHLQALISRVHNDDKVVIFERAGLLFLFNFHPTRSYLDYRVGIEKSGMYVILQYAALDSFLPCWVNTKRNAKHARFLSCQTYCEDAHILINIDKCFLQTILVWKI